MWSKSTRSLLRTVVLNVLVALSGTGLWLFAQEVTPVFKSKVDLVVLSFTVTDNKGKYVNGLKPSDFKVMEDGILQKLATFSEGDKPAMQILENGQLRPLLPNAPEAQQINAGGDALVAPTFSFSSIPATSCTRALCMRRTLLPISCAVWTKPIR